MMAGPAPKSWLEDKMEEHVQEAAARPLEDVAALTRSVERIFRRLLRFLVGRMSLARILEMIRQIFIEEAEAHLRRQDPNGNVTMSRLALLAGLDSRTINRVRRSPEYGRPLHAESGFLRDINPGLRAIDLWVGDPRFSDGDGRPRELPLQGEDDSFQALVRAAFSTRGVTHTPVLERMLDAGVVELRGNRVALVQQEYYPFASGDEFGMVEVGCSAIAQLVDTVTHNIASIESGEPRFYQRASWTYDLAPERVEEYRRVMHDFLSRCDAEARRKIEPFEQPQGPERRVTAGVSMFYFESAQDEGAARP